MVDSDALGKQFPGAGSQLERYARCLRAVEITSSFYVFTSFYLDGAYRAGVSFLARTATGLLVVCFWPLIAMLLLISRCFPSGTQPR